jgi:RHS repeat-associated protein
VNAQARPSWCRATFVNIVGFTDVATIEYYHLDAIGSVRAVTNQSGAVIERHDYQPFGEELNPPTGSQSHQFTGQERDAETGMDYFGARYYSGKRARFTTIDPVYTWQENLVDPQRWNRYAYVRNNPLRYTDPDVR